MRAGEIARSCERAQIRHYGHPDARSHGGPTLAYVLGPMNQLMSFALGSLVVTAACTSSHTVTPAEYDDTAQAVGSTASGTSGGDVVAMTDVMVIAHGGLPLGFALSTDGHVHGTRVGLDYDYALTCSDTAGTTLPSCGATTDGVDVSLTLTGQLLTGGFDASMSRTGSWRVTGMQSPTTTFDGKGTFDFDATLRSVFRPGAVATYAFAYDASYDAVRIDSSSRQVIDGAASFDASVRHTIDGTNHDSDVTFDVNADIAFHADRTASLVLDDDQHYTIDLDTGAVSRGTAN